MFGAVVNGVPQVAFGAHLIHSYRVRMDEEQNKDQEKVSDDDVENNSMIYLQNAFTKEVEPRRMGISLN